MNEGITWRYGGIELEENNDYEYRSAVLGERLGNVVRGAGKPPVVHYMKILILFLL